MVRRWVLPGSGTVFFHVRTRVRCNMLTSNQHVKYSSRKTSCAYGCTGWVVKGSEGGEHLQTSTIFKIGRRVGHLCGVYRSSWRQKFMKRRIEFWRCVMFMLNLLHLPRTKLCSSLFSDFIYCVKRLQGEYSTVYYRGKGSWVRSSFKFILWYCDFCIVFLIVVLKVLFELYSGFSLNFSRHSSRGRLEPGRG